MVEEIRHSVGLFAAALDLLQRSQDHDAVDLCELLKRLVAMLQETSGRAISLHSQHIVPMSGARAVNIAIVVNELVSNSLKHTASAVRVSCEPSDGEILIRVMDGSAFDLQAGQGRGFGSKTMMRMVASWGGSIAALPLAEGGGLMVRVPIVSPAHDDAPAPPALTPA